MMKDYTIVLLTLIVPFMFFMGGLLYRFYKNSSPEFFRKTSVFITAGGILIATFSVLSIFFGNSLYQWSFGRGIYEMSFRLDSLGAVMLSMIVLLAFIVMRYSLNYLDGDSRQHIFLSRLCMTIAPVLLMVLSGSLGALLFAWVWTSFSLQQLLIFYRDRPRARLAVRKKFIVARIGDLCLSASFILLYVTFDSANLQTIFDSFSIQSIASPVFEIATLLLCIAAILKSAQFPTYGWLIEVMETPTPVSALLHAGLLNAGPFLIVRMAALINMSQLAPVILITVGGGTALIASVAFLTQPAIKTALGYSSVAHMGFMLLICGLGVYPAAILHLVAHSFYKAHAFLSSGSVVDSVKTDRVNIPQRSGRPSRIILGLATSMIMYLAFAYLWGATELSFALWATGLIIVLGTSQILIPVLDSAGKWQVIFLACMMSSMVTLAFFSLESSMHAILNSQLPPLRSLNNVALIMAILVLFAFTLTIIFQSIVPPKKRATFLHQLAIHFRHGFYANSWFDRLVYALDLKPHHTLK